MSADEPEHWVVLGGCPGLGISGPRWPSGAWRSRIPVALLGGLATSALGSEPRVHGPATVTGRLAVQGVATLCVRACGHASYPGFQHACLRTVPCAYARQPGWAHRERHPYSPHILAAPPCSEAESHVSYVRVRSACACIFLGDDAMSGIAVGSVASGLLFVPPARPVHVSLPWVSCDP